MQVQVQMVRTLINQSRCSEEVAIARVALLPNRPSASTATSLANGKRVMQYHMSHPMCTSCCQIAEQAS